MLINFKYFSDLEIRQKRPISRQHHNVRSICQLRVRLRRECGPFLLSRPVYAFGQQRTVGVSAQPRGPFSPVVWSVCSKSSQLVSLLGRHGCIDFCKEPSWSYSSFWEGGRTHTLEKRLEFTKRQAQQKPKCSSEDRGEARRRQEWMNGKNSSADSSRGRTFSLTVASSCSIDVQAANSLGRLDSIFCLIELWYASVLPLFSYLLGFDFGSVIGHLGYFVYDC